MWNDGGGSSFFASAMRTMSTTTTMATMGADCGNDNGRNDNDRDEHCDDAGVVYKNNDGDYNDGDLNEDDGIGGDKDESTINNSEMTTMATINRMAATMAT
jgi:hypothetical protein